MFWCFGKKARNYHCKIVLLDETEFIHDIQEASRGQQLLDVVFKHLNLMETAYFGLRFIDGSGQRHWLDPNKNIVKQMKGMETFTFYFGVKFYASDPCKLLEEITRYQFFLQVKQDVCQGRLPLTYELAAELFAYTIQSELGDYDPRRHLPGYAAEFNFITNQTKDLEAKAMDIHKSLCGTVPAVAEINFLDRIKWLDMYGVDLHPVLGEDSIEYYLGLTPSGILVLRNKTKVGNYFWPRINKVYYKRKYFMVRARDKNNEQNTYGFELPNKRACKHLWKCCMEHRAFFKLTQIREVPGQSGKIVGLDHKFYGNVMDKSQNTQMKARLRTPPTFVRVPSRRFNKRLGQPDGADAGPQSKEETMKHMLEPSSMMSPIPQAPIIIPALHRSTSVPSVVPSPYKIMPAPWEDHRMNSRGLYSSCTNPSPRSVRSAGNLPSRRYPFHGRTGSIESTTSYDYRKRKHHHSRRQSDNESEVSKSSKCSKTSRSSRHRRNGSQSGGDGSDSEHSQHRHKRHSRRKKHGSTYELVDSEGQWKEVQRQQQEQAQMRMQNAVVRDLSKRKSGYMNSGLETESESNYQQRRRHRRHRSRSPDSKSALPHDVKKYIDYNLVDPSSLTEEEKRDIKYTEVQSDNSRLFKIRYSSSQGQHSKNSPSSRSSNGNLHKVQPMDDPGPPPPYSTDHPPNGFLSSHHQRLVDIEEKNENETVQIPKVVSLHAMQKNPVGFKERFGNSGPQKFSKQHQGQEWAYNKSSTSLNKSQNFLSEDMSNSKTSRTQENSMNGTSGHLAKNIRLVSSHFLPSSPKTGVTVSAPRVTFQNDDVSKHYPKTTTSSQSWVKCSPRQNGEVPKSSEKPQGTPGNHEMSTEL